MLSGGLSLRRTGIHSDDICNGPPRFPGSRGAQRLTKVKKEKNMPNTMLTRRTVLRTAALALVVSLWSAYEDRRHKRLSVRPQMTITFIFNATDAGWTLTNSGLGPAIIQRFEVYVDDKPNESWDTFADSLGLTPPRSFGFGNPASFEIVPALAPSGWLFTVKAGSGYDVVLKNWERVRMELCYCSLYDECWLVSTRRGSRKTISSCELPRLGEKTWHGNARPPS